MPDFHTRPRTLSMVSSKPHRRCTTTRPHSCPLPVLHTVQEWGVHQLCFEVDTEPYATARDERVRQLAEQAGVKVFSPVSHTLYVGAWVLYERVAVEGRHGNFIASFV